MGTLLLNKQVVTRFFSHILKVNPKHLPPVGQTRLKATVQD